MNNRETAMVAWLGLLLIGAMLVPDIRKALRPLMGVLADRRVIALLLSFAAYMAGVLWIGGKAGWWNAELSADSVVCIGATLGLLVGINDAGKPGYFGEAVRKTIRLVLILEVVIGLYVFTFPIEFILVPILTLTALIGVVAAMKPETQQVKTMIDCVLVVVGMYLMVHAVASALGDWASFWDVETARRWVLPFWVTVAAIPYLYVIAVWTRYSVEFAMINWKTSDRVARGRAKLAIALGVGPRLRSISRYPRICTFEICDTDGLRTAWRTVRDFMSGRRRDEWEEALQELEGLDGDLPD